MEGDRFPLSVVVIARDEERDLEECLKSARWANEIIVVVDERSKDRTEEIARALADKVFIRKMKNEGEHRNWAYAQARNEWVLSLDADERITEELREEICQRLKKGEKRFSGFAIPRKNFLGDYWIKFGGEYPAGQLKLFKKDLCRLEEVEVHPRIFLQGEWTCLSSPLLHYSSRDISDFIHKFNSQTTLEAEKWWRTNREVCLFHILRRAIDRFFRKYVYKKGYKDGFIGFFLALFAGLYQIVSFAKYIEKKGRLERDEKRSAG
ncbi:MAG: glycosyltransferase family 2 protein [Candidatus Omnitrophota bacterium]|nr:MAG: glycosyltransferase family 2 protein [Candidatus Omnitrophota bacterium]